MPAWSVQLAATVAVLLRLFLRSQRGAPRRYGVGFATTIVNFGADLRFAKQLADAAAAVSLSYFRRELKRWTKDDGSLATEADVAVEDKIRGMVAHERPGD